MMIQSQASSSSLTLGNIVRDTYSFDTAYDSRMLVHIFRPPGPIPTKPHLLISVFGVDAFQRNQFGNSNAYNSRSMSMEELTPTTTIQKSIPSTSRRERLNRH
jgi:hypothetical protein